MINSTTKLTCLLGSPVKQSLSPIIHNYLFRKYNINNIYTCFDVENIESAIKSIKTLNILGCNITIPHKVNVIDYLDFIDDNALLIGAVNTIKNEDNILKGYNTDGEGFVKSISDKGYLLKSKKVLVIGAGGASRSICVSLAKEGVHSIKIINRTISKAENLCETINSNFNTECSFSNKDILCKDLEEADIIINTTSIGMDSDLCPINTDIRVDKNLLVCDIVYKPHETTFIKWAKDNNLNVIYGIDMLINQAFESFFIWTGIKPDESDFLYIKSIYRN